MYKNTAGQSISAQMTQISDGDAFTGTVTCYVTIDDGSQAIGTVGSGVCVHDGGGQHTYFPSQAETNGNHVRFQFRGTGAVAITQDVYPELTEAQRIAILREGMAAAEPFIQSMFDPSGGLTIYANQDYTIETGRIPFSGALTTEWPDLSDGEFATIELHITVNNRVLVFTNFERVDPGEAQQFVYMTLDHDDTAKLLNLANATATVPGFSQSGSGTYSLYAIKDDTPKKHRKVLARGAVSIVRTDW